VLSFAPLLRRDVVHGNITFTRTRRSRKHGVHGNTTATGCRARSSVIEFAFFNDAFVRLAAALDPVLDLSIAARKLTEHFVVASSCIPIREAPI
jgi:hypothetical protein